MKDKRYIKSYVNNQTLFNIIIIYAIKIEFIF